MEEEGGTIEESPEGGIVIKHVITPVSTEEQALDPCA
jgi:hypothetical protein